VDFYKLIFIDCQSSKLLLSLIRVTIHAELEIADEQSNVVRRNLPTTKPFGNSPSETDPNAVTPSPSGRLTYGNPLRRSNQAGGLD